MIKTIRDLEQAIELGVDEDIIQSLLPMGTSLEMAMGELRFKKFILTLSKLDLSGIWAV